VSGDTELLVFGSWAILGTFPEAPEDLRASIEVDVQAKNLSERTDFIDGALGELSQFHATYGFYERPLPGGRRPRPEQASYVTTLLVEKLIDGETLMARPEALPVAAERRESIGRWVRLTLEDLV